MNKLITYEQSSEHTDATWGVHWTVKDKIVSSSADGTVHQWDASSGQSIAARPAHAIGINSLSVSTAGDRALYNSLEGTTTLWDLETNEAVGTHESYVRSGEGSEPGEEFPLFLVLA